MRKWLQKIQANRWRVYSGFLTFAMVVAVSCSVASARKYTIEGGQIKAQSVLGTNVWQDLSWNAPLPNSVSQADLDAQWAAFAQEVGLSGGSGGLTQAQLESSLANYIGNRISSYTFLGGDGKNGTVIVHDLYDAIALNQLYSTLPLYSSYSGDWLTETHGLVFTSSPQSLSDIVRHGFAALGQTIGLFGSGGSYFTMSTVGKGTSGHKVYNFYQAFREFFEASTLNQYRDYTLQDKMFALESEWYPKLNTSLVGPDGVASAQLWNSETKEEEDVEYDNLLAAIVSLQADMRNDLAKLRYVLASDADIEIEENVEPVKGSVKDNFTGDSSAAVKPDDISGMSGFSGGIQDSFNTGANAGDLFGFINSSDTLNFWSQDVANSIDAVPRGASDDEEEYLSYYDIEAIERYLAGEGS